MLKKQKIARDLDSVRERISQQEQRIEGTYTIGFHPQVGAYSFPKFGSSLLTKSQKLNTKLVYDTSRRILSEVVDFKIDFGIVVNPLRHPELTIIKLYKNMIRFWALETPTELQTLSNQNSVFFCARSLPQMEALLLKAMREQGMQTRRVIDTLDLDVIREYVIGGLGIGILPDSVAQKNRRDQLRPLEYLPYFGEQICLIFRADMQKSQASKFIKNTIIAAFA